MKPKTHSTSLRTLFLIAPLSLYLPVSTFAQGKDRDLTLAAIRPVVMDSRPQVKPALSEGYLKVYSATDGFNDGDAWYFPHSSYSIYTMDGKLFKNVQNHISRSDEIPEIVMLPVGAYTIDARSEQKGYVRIRVLIKPGRQTTLSLDLRENQQRPVLYN